MNITSSVQFGVVGKSPVEVERRRDTRKGGFVHEKWLEARRYSTWMMYVRAIPAHRVPCLQSPYNSIL
jgi:hypothetical protein